MTENLVEEQPWDCRRKGHRFTEFYTAQEAVDQWGDHGGPVVACAECPASRRFKPSPDFWVSNR